MVRSTDHLLSYIWSAFPWSNISKAVTRGAIVFTKCSYIFFWYIYLDVATIICFFSHLLQMGKVTNIVPVHLSFIRRRRGREANNPFLRIIAIAPNWPRLLIKTPFFCCVIIRALSPNLDQIVFSSSAYSLL